ncbi:VOC family protein [Niveispirillum sp. KHB5.9]|uniref:VOC family protein n=1 Tax=Niveispirillum sp. KHB5.9 TaxID=3400269 RepID=UPI003A84125E
MSRLFGPIMQNGFVVRDLEAAMRHWVGLGVGPFFVLPRVEFAEVTYRGRPTQVEMAVATSYSGSLQIELVQQLNDAPSIYQEFLDQGRAGLHHVGVATTDYAADLARVMASGLDVAMGGSTAAGTGFAYFDSAGDFQGSMVELFEATPGLMKFFAKVEAASRGWDGTDPIRRPRG